MDERKLYIKQLLRNYINYKLPSKVYTVTYRTQDSEESLCKMFEHNEGIDFIIRYIEELEQEVENTQNVKEIIKIAKNIT